MVVQLNDAPKPSIHHCTMVLRGSTGAPIWHQYHKLLGQQSQLFQVRKYLINHMMRYTHRNECLPHDKLTGTCEFHKLPICLEPIFRWIPWQSGSFRGIFYPVQLDKNQKLISLFTCRV